MRKTVICVNYNQMTLEERKQYWENFKELSKSVSQVAEKQNSKALGGDILEK